MKTDKYSTEHLKYNFEDVVDGNAYSIMGYVKRAMLNEGLTQEDVSEYMKDAMSSNYGHLCQVSKDMIDKLNEHYQ